MYKGKQNIAQVFQSHQHQLIHSEHLQQKHGLGCSHIQTEWLHNCHLWTIPSTLFPASLRPGWLEQHMAHTLKITQHWSCAAFPTEAELNPLNHLAVPHAGHRGGRLTQLSFPQQNDRCASFKMTLKISKLPFLSLSPLQGQISVHGYSRRCSSLMLSQLNHMNQF